MSELNVVMRFAGPNDQLRGIIRFAALLGAGAIVAGCSSGGSLPSITGSLPTWFARPSPAAQAQASGGPAAPASNVSLEDDCPSVAIRTGAGTFAVGAKQQDPTPNDLRYQLTFLEMARQCFVDAGTVRMRVGVQGRAVLGPAGSPSQVSAPIRYAVVQEGVQPKTIVTKFRRVPVALDSNSTVFTDIEEDLSFPMPPPADLQKYVVYVGFDEAGDRGRPQSKRKKAPKAQKPPPKRLERSVAPEFRR
ncbi:MAG: hypothetical protein GEU95_10990 [Rhizobiales bacterium]|nr:hypothetical protein [Hyphomicrobiales bacterium]